MDDLVKKSEILHEALHYIRRFHQRIANRRGDTCKRGPD